MFRLTVRILGVELCDLALCTSEDGVEYEDEPEVEAVIDGGEVATTFLGFDSHADGRWEPGTDYVLGDEE